MSIIKIDIHSLNTQQKIDNLINKLDINNKYQLDFEHIKFLPKELIEKLYTIKHKITINVQNIKLAYYLLNLGFELHQKDYKKTNYYNILDNIKRI